MTVHSKDGDMQTTKLERIGRLAAEKKDTVFNNLGHIVDLHLLRESYHQLDGNKAVGIDGVSKVAWQVNLEDNLQSLLQRIRQEGYKPQPSRLVEIPKEDGSKRPLAISCLEDKIVQSAVAAILTKIYEPLFLPVSYGYREGVDGHEALRALMRYSNETVDGATVEIDLRKYFNSIPHEVLMKILSEKICDTRFLRLIERLIRTPVMEEGKAEINRRGVPQGSIISPILSNIYLHHVIDEWFGRISQTHMRGRARQVRFADDMVFVFQNMDDALRFYEVLPKRLIKHGLELHADKSSVIRTGKKAAAEVGSKGERLPNYKFLGFTCYWGQSRDGSWRLKYKSRSDRFTAKLNGLKKYLKENLNTETQSVIKSVGMVVRGWINYHAISDNQKKVESFIYQTTHILFIWRNRKGGQRKLNWTRFSRLLTRMAFPRTFKTKSMFATC